ncbi:MAG: signal peptidase I [Oscillospiraceae bacterium]|nr:signal peptidase I [Oscillospiraceae bacterium]
MLSLVGTTREDGIFGYRVYRVLSDSMRGEFSAGDIVFSEPVEGSGLSVDDIITYKSVDPEFFGQVVTHRIISIRDGGASFITQGDANETPDLTPVPASNVLGRYVFRLPAMGHVVEFFYTPLGYILIVLTPFTVFAVLSGVRFLNLLRAAKRSKNEERTGQMPRVEGQELRVEGQTEEMGSVGQEPQVEKERQNGDDAMADELSTMRAHLEELYASRDARLEPLPEMNMEERPEPPEPEAELTCEEKEEPQKQEVCE